jgi:hypothetical protein
MGRNAAGVYSKPAGTTAISGSTISSAKYNELADDLVAAFNTIPLAVSTFQTVANLLADTTLNYINTQVGSIVTVRDGIGPFLVLSGGVIDADTATAGGLNLADLSKRTTFAFQHWASQPNGTTFTTSDGLSYIVDDTVILANSAGAHEGVAGIKPHGDFVTPDHYFTYKDGVTLDTVAFERAEAECARSRRSMLIREGEYAARWNVTQPYLTVFVFNGVTIYADTSHSFMNIRITPTAHHFTLNGNRENFRLSGQTKAQEVASSETCSALHCIQIEAQYCTIRGVKAGAARMDGIYIAMPGNIYCGLVCEDFHITDNARNGISLVAGFGLTFLNGIVENDGLHVHDTGGGVILRNFALYDCEPNAGQVARMVRFRRCRFLSGSPTSGGHNVLMHEPRDGGIDVWHWFEDCEFGRYEGPTYGPILSAAALRVARFNLADPLTLSHIYVKNCRFAERIFANTAAYTLKQTHLEKIRLGTLNVFFNAQLDGDCSAKDITSALTGPLAGMNVHPRTYLRNVQGVELSWVERKKITLSGTGVIDILQCGTRGDFDIVISATTSGTGGRHHKSRAYAQVSNDLTDGALGAIIDNGATGLIVQWAAPDGSGDLPRKLQVQPRSTAMNLIIVEVTVRTAYPDQSTVTWLA